jgi:hypothetical protein
MLLGATQNYRNTTPSTRTINIDESCAQLRVLDLLGVV